MKHWYVLHTHANKEARAEINLLRQGFESWLPLYRKKRRHAGRQEIVLRPLFPRYIFVRVDLEKDKWRSLLSTFGVSRVIGDTEGPYPLEDYVIEDIRKRGDSDGIFSISPQKFSSGNKVRITSGPFSDLEAVFHESSDSKRVLVLLKLMGQEVRARVLKNDIELV